MNQLSRTFIIDSNLLSLTSHTMGFYGFLV